MILKHIKGEIKYITLIIFYGILFFILGVTLAKLNEQLFPIFDKSTLSKPKHIILIEVILQILTTIIITYMIRSIVKFIFDNLLQFKNRLNRSPDKFSVIIVAPTMFAAQPNLTNKIRYIWSIKSAEKNLLC